MKTISLLSPAKINLFLHVANKRDDGYHNLASLFQCVSLFDKLQFSLSDDSYVPDSLICSDSSLPVDDSNLVRKAIKAFRCKSQKKFSVAVSLEKNIPQRAGLGGGSSNAATTLYALNTLLNSPFTDAELIQIGSELGSDVPFFLSQGTAYCMGRGEIVENLPLPLSLQNTELTLVKPNIGLSTPAVYKCLNLSKSDPVNPRDVCESFFTYQQWNRLFNDLEAPAFTLEPALSSLKSDLYQAGYSFVQMSGSGSAFFCIGNGSASLYDHLPLASWTVRFVNRTSKQWYA